MLRLKKPMAPLATSSSDPTHARHEILLEVAESIAAHRQLSTLFADLSRSLKRLVPFDFITLTLLDPKEQVFRVHILQTDQPVVAQPRLRCRGTSLLPALLSRLAGLTMPLMWIASSPTP